jgi:hypothetical protein
VGLRQQYQPRLNPFERFQTNSNKFQTHSNLIRSKNDLLRFEKYEIKYGCEEFDERNKFPYRNVLRFKNGF